MLAARGQLWFAGVVLALFSGCAGSVGRMVAELDGREAAVELQGVPFHTQVTDQCGPAALASVLNDADVEVSPETLKSRVYLPGRQGTLQLELLAATRHYARIPYEIDPTMTALVAELDAQRPVLVLQNLGVSVAPIWHYAVVVGYLPDRKRIVLRSGDHERLLLRATTFARSWKRAGYWGIVILAPGELPVDPDPERYLRAVAAVESTGGVDVALPAYEAATGRWPDDGLAWLGLGNASYARGALEQARQAYERALDVDPGDAVTMNNLSEVHLEMGCREQALATINAAIDGSDEADAVRSHLLRTRDEILRSPAGRDCH